MKRLIKHIINWLFFRCCFKESLMAAYIVMYYLPTFIRTDSSCLDDGHYFFAQLENVYNTKTKEMKTTFTPLVGVKIEKDK